MFRVEYELHDVDREARPFDLSEGATLRDAIEDYRPRSSRLGFMFGDRCVSIDIGRDMGFLYEELLILMENLAAGSESEGPFLSQVGFFGRRERVYSVMMTVAHEPQYMFVAPRGESLDVVTRTLRGDALVAASEYNDVDRPISCDRGAFAYEIRCFLERYFHVLGAVFPGIARTEECADYLESLSFAADAISESSR